MRFPYQRYTVAGIGSHLTTVWRPALLVRVIGPAGDDTVFGRVDTGADDTLLPDFLIAPLGVALDPAAVATIEGIDGGTVPVRYGAVDLELADATSSFRWNALVGFYPRHNAVFGLSGFLDYFQALFHGRTRELSLLPNGTAPPPVYP